MPTETLDTAYMTSTGLHPIAHRHASRQLRTFFDTRCASCIQPQVFRPGSRVAAPSERRYMCARKPLSSPIEHVITQNHGSVCEEPPAHDAELHFALLPGCRGSGLDLAPACGGVRALEAPMLACYSTASELPSFVRPSDAEHAQYVRLEAECVRAGPYPRFEPCLTAILRASSALSRRAAVKLRVQGILNTTTPLRTCP